MASSETAHSFGHMAKYDLEHAPHGYRVPAMGPRFEIMMFLREGRAHMHDVAELAICIEGSGSVRGFLGKSAERSVSVCRGESVYIPAGWSHWMEPGPEGLRMLILYAVENAAVDSGEGG